ncbi:hypothetical protein SLEP1_g16622 [Rubroshorea leprosula]|uniref:RNase H type-1 domain-containing protein n=1 Tax=Rubroshorea leprosula TaxID=152421 RepID=A0AAV5J1Y4_9ROSI|nr:hypothetical protein SLEP1_g16622 [Rubroshorea leprosula]
MPPRKSRDKEVQPAQAEHANDPITFLPVSPLAKRSYGNPIFKERDADRGGDFAESSDVFRGMTERLDLAFKEQNQAMQRLVESQAEFSRRQEETIRQCMSELRQIFEKGTNMMRETGDESRRTLQAVLEQVVEQVRQPRPEIPPPVHFVIGERQRQHELMEAATLVANHGHQPQHKYILPGRKGNVGPHHQPCPRDFFQPQVPPAQPVRRGLQNQPTQFFNRDHGPTLRPLEKIDKDILRFPDKAKEIMGVDADPFPAVSVGVNVADLKSVARNRSLPYAQKNLAAEDLRWVLEAQRSRQSRSVRSDQQRLGGQERITVTRNFSPEGARRYSTGTRSPRMMAIKGQALADFLADHPCLDVEADEEKWINLFSISLVPWKLIFDGSSTESMSGAGVVVISLSGLKTQMSFQLDFNCTNNQAEYEALIIGLEMLVELKVSMVEVIGDSQLVLKQLSGEYKCTSLALAPYFALAVQLLEEFDDVSIRHVPRDENYEANEMAQIASGLRIPEGVMQKVVIVEKRSLPSIHQRDMTVSTCSIDVTQTDWRFPIIQYLKDQSIKVSKKTKMQAFNYVLIEDVLYRRGNDELLLRCLGPDESFQMLSNVHDGICGAHQVGIRMRWLIRKHGFFWPSVLKDCIAYAKGCKSCQIHGPLQRVPASELNSIVKPWPFRG